VVTVFPGIAQSALRSLFAFFMCGNMRLTELISGTPIDPASPRSGIVEALQRCRAGVDGVAARADVGLRVGVVHLVGVGITTTTTTTTRVGTGGDSRHF